MSCSSYVPLACLSYIVLLFSSLVVAQDATDGSAVQADKQVSNKAKEISSIVDMKHLANGFHSANADLGALIPGQKYLATIAILNPSESDLEIDKTKTSCACTEFSVSAKSIPAGNSVDSKVAFTMPKSTKDGIYTFSVDLFGGGKHVLRLTVLAQVLGNLHINKAHRVVELGDGLNTVQIPVFLSEPIRHRDLIPFKSDALGDAALSIVEDSGSIFLKIVVHSSELEHSYLSGNVGVVDSVSKKRADLSLLFSRSTPFRISPLLPRFKQSNIDDDLVANIMMQIVDEKLAPAGKLKIECWIAEKKVKRLEVRKLSNLVYRMKIRLSDDEVEAIDSSVENFISWKFGFKSFEGVGTSNFALPNN